MANYIENQPVFLGTTDTCSNDVDFVYNQLVDITDTTQFQLSIAPCISAENLIVNPNFEEDSDWTLTGNVGIADNQLCFAGDTTTSDAAFTSSIYTNGDYYQVEIIVDSISGGAMDVYLGSTLIGSFDSIGTFTYYGFATVLGVSYPLLLVPNEDGVECCISTVSSFNILTNFIIGVYNTSDVYQNQISYNSNPSYFTFSKDTVTVDIDWSELSLEYGCYYLCVLDPCVNTGGQNYPPVIENPNFNTDTIGWSLGSSWVYILAQDAVEGTYDVVTANNVLLQNDVFNSFTNSYSVVIDVTSITGNLEVYFGNNLVDTISTTGVHTVTGLCTVNFRLRLRVTSGVVRVDSVVAGTVSSDNYVCDFTSNTFKLNDYSNECTLLVNACNNEDGLGFVFDGSGFTPRLRLNAKLKEPKYNNERFTYTDSKGKKQVYWFTGRKQKYFCTDLEPEYILDYLWSLFGYDNIYIEDELYVVDDDEFNPTYSFDNVGSVKFLVSKKIQDIKNTNCSSEENNCVIGENYLIQANNNSEFVVQTNGDYILIN